VGFINLGRIADREQSTLYRIHRARKYDQSAGSKWWSKLVEGNQDYPAPDVHQLAHDPCGHHVMCDYVSVDEQSCDIVPIAYTNISRGRPPPPAPPPRRCWWWWACERKKEMAVVGMWLGMWACSH
jgi:hypothetical protein